MIHSTHLNTRESKKATIFIQAITDLAKASVPYSFFISKILWGASLYLHRGVFAEQWQVYDRISDAARAVREGGQKDWKKQLTFEHCKPLKALYSELLHDSKTLTPERVIDIIAEYPPVIITREENGRISNNHKAQGNPNARYALAGIVCSFPLAVSVEKVVEDQKIEDAPQDHVRVCPECGQEVLDEE
jgi:hypothetical protein